MNQAYAVTGNVEEQFLTIALTVTKLTLLASPYVNTDDEPIEDVAG